MLAAADNRGNSRSGERGEEKVVLEDSNTFSTMFNGFSFNIIDHILTDIGGMIGNPLQVPGNEEKVNCPRDIGCILHHIGQKFSENLIVEFVHLIIPAADGYGLLVIPADEGVNGIADHFLCDGGHLGNIDQRFEKGGFHKD